LAVAWISPDDGPERRRNDMRTRSKSDKSAHRKKQYLEERARISQEVADGKIVVSYDEISPERWEKLGEMLEGAGFDRPEGRLG
jgi:hypothetical protein